MGEADVDGLIYGFKATHYYDHEDTRAAIKLIKDWIKQHPERRYLAGQNDRVDPRYFRPGPPSWGWGAQRSSNTETQQQRPQPTEVDVAALEPCVSSRNRFDAY